MQPVDLRSDTVTRPGPDMRAAMANAAVGDDVLGEDPTVRALEERVAELTGKDAALFVPSGTMGNQLALRVQSEPGRQLVCHRDSHVYCYEAGGPAVLSGLHVTCIDTDDGSMPWERVEAALHPDDPHCAPPGLVAVENTHNRCGGRVFAPEAMAGTARAARARGLRVHLDGARLWNAAAALERPLAEFVADVDTASLCFSKGLGAPVGSVLVGDRATIARARRWRKLLGGGMRQVGVLAAACTVALDHNRDRLVDDHRRARRLHTEVAHTSLNAGAPPESNIVLFDVDPGTTSGRVAEALAACGVLVSSFGDRRVRMVTHLDVDDAALDRALDAIAAAGSVR